MATIRRARATAPIIAAAVLALTVAGPTSAQARARPELRADLEGKPIELAHVGRWYCHDLAYPQIHCFSDPQHLEASTQAALDAWSVTATAADGDLVVASAGMTYLTVYEYTTYQGAYMHMSQDYALLSLIGWNDRISSFKVRNGQSGVFWTDWLYSGTRYAFCCGWELGSLGSFNDTFSSVFRN